VGLYGEPVDLEDIRRDVRALGFIPSKIYQRERSHKIKTKYGVVKFARTESVVHCGSTALAVLLRCLGATAGNKARQDFNLPIWLNRAPQWMKRLYLASLFGAELTTPRTITNHPYNFYGPELSLNKRQANSESGRQFLEGIQAWLYELGVESSIIRDSENFISREGHISIRLRLQISSRPKNLIKLWSTIGLEYNRRKQYLANVAVQYLRLKSLILEERRAGIKTTLALGKSGLTPEQITTAIGSS
jgi:tRNA-splicing ligase RtcB